MAAEVVGGAFLTVSLEVLSGRIHSIIDFVRRNKVDAGLLNKLEIMLLSVSGVLSDAEKKQLTNSAVRQWLQKLKDAIHDAEDLVDEINTEALRCQIEDHQSQSSRTSGTASFSQVYDFFSSRLNVKDVEQRIKDILDTLKFIVKQKKHLGLKEGAELSISSFRRSCATALVEESDIYGRDADKRAVIEFLKTDKADKVISVHSIVGMGGMGKTTLAQLVYNEINDRMKPFDIKAWVTVSEESDVFALTKTIYEEVTHLQSSNFKETFKLQLELKEFLKGKRFLLVLDDVWNVDRTGWCNLEKPFASSARGSKIIVTTRSDKVASDLGTVSKLDLQLLSVEDCWKLFKKHAFNDVEARVDPGLESIGRQIVHKCNGLPLAVKSLSSLLYSVRDPKEWENILKSDIWNLKGGNVLPALWLSYYYLPPYTKGCFSYCSIFPKDYKIEKEKLILLWMAQDLLQPHETKIPEEVGEEYVKDLVSRSFFKCSRGVNGDYITMHDLVNDLAMFVSGERCLRLQDKCSDVLIKKTRHCSYLAGDTSDGDKKIKHLCENKVLRTLLSVDMHNFEQLQSFQYLRVLSPDIQSRMKLLNSIGNLKLLRYLDLSESEFEEIPDTIGTLYNLQTLLLRGWSELTSLPDSIGNLKHLRYLDLSGSSIEKLPDTICKLDKLHTLRLNGCDKLTHLPTKIATLTDLRILDIYYTELREMPPQMSNLKNLRTLRYYAVGKDSGCNIKELGELKDLQGDLKILGLENVVNAEDVEENLIDKKRITELELEWNDDVDDSVKAQKVLDSLRPHTDIEELSIDNYGGTRFSHWVGHPSFSCMTNVRLLDCKNCYMLPPLGQLPSLEHLEISGLDKVGRIGHEFYSDGSSITNKPFQSLKTLRFEGMAEWEEWALVQVDGGVFTNVKELELWNCPKLKGACLPDYLPSLETLYISHNHHLVASLSMCRYPSLRSLIIYNLEMESFPGATLPSNIQRNCPELVSLSEEGWPSNLKSLNICFCWHALQWNLGMLTSLTSLSINLIFAEEMDAFPKEEGQLPTSLTSLQLNCLSNLKSLNGSALRHLTSLQHLGISECHQIQCLPQERLPESLSELKISSCPLLKPRCQRGIGEDWPSISHIPRILIDWEEI